jgi:hypothetical protein
MFKKTVVLSVAVALILLGLFVDPSAAQNNVTSTSKRGSLLVWPKIATSGNLDTIIMIGNDAASGTTIKCYWMDDGQNTWDFEVALTAYQPAWFSAKTGNGSKGVSEFGTGVTENGIGELKCWAIDPSPTGASAGTLEQLKKFNYLYGNAIIIDPDVERAFEYNAWSFFLGTLDAGDVNGALKLDGTQYDYCPGYLVYNFFSKGASLTTAGPSFGDSTLALAPCMQDLRQDRSPICAKAKFDVWNENENKLTGAYQCIKCWFEGVLTEIGTQTWDGCDLPTCKYTGVGGTKFAKGTLKTNMGRFRVSPDTFNACANVFKQYDLDDDSVVNLCPPENWVKTPFLGVLLTDVKVDAATGAANAWAGKTGTTAGTYTTSPTPEIKWDPAENFQAPRR